MIRVTINLSEEEQAALVALARHVRRDPRDQAAIEIRRALEKSGFLAPTNGSQSSRKVVSTNGAH